MVPDTKTGNDPPDASRLEASRPADESGPAVLTSGLTRRFGDIVAVDRVDLDVPRGAVFGLLGPDGAGKSTLIRMLATPLAPDSGEALIFGSSVARPGEIVHRIGYMSQRFSMYPDLSVAENVEFFGRLRGVPPVVRAERSSRLLEGMGLSEFVDRQAQFLSGGMKQKLMLAATLVHEPDLLLLDEPTTGVDPVSRREFWRIIASLHQQGKTVLVATPYMDEAERCTHIAFMDGGRVLSRGTPAEVRSQVPGALFEVISEQPRAARDAIAGTPGLASLHLFGDVLRVLAAPGGPDLAGLTERLKAADVTGEVRLARVDMEAAYAYLAEHAEAVGGATASGETPAPSAAPASSRGADDVSLLSRSEDELR